MQVTDFFQQATSAPVWQHGSIELTCQQVIQETHDVKTFVFQSPSLIRFHFKPGQFITLELDIDGKTLHRSYTISSSPSTPYALAVTIKKVEGGQVSGWILDNIKPGSKIKATGPDGVFNIIDHPAEKVLFLSAGCGITPMMSMSRWLLDTAAPADIRFVHSARSQTDIIFKNELHTINTSFEHFKLDYVLEDTDGYLTAERLQQLVPDLHSRTVYICGPEAYMTSVEQMLSQCGFPMNNFHKESFGAPTPQQPEAEQAQSGSYEVTLEKSGKAVVVEPGEFVLDTLLNQQAPIIGACRAGVCGACKVKITEGSVNSASQMTLTTDEIAQGYVLSCCSTPESDLRIDI